MKTVLLSAAVGAAAVAISSADAIVLPQGAPHYNQFGTHPLPRSVAGSGSIKIPMFQQSKRDLSDPEQTFKFAAAQREYALAKWGKGQDKKKRQIIGLSDYGQDNFYFGQVSVGTPKQNFNVILDTGSADFWLADTACTNQQCDGVALFNPGGSSTYKSSTTPFSITYGTGAVKGYLSADTVSLAGYTVDDQTFAIAEQLADNSLNAPTSGIMGMGFQSLAQSGATPFWQVLVEQNKLSDNLFTFQMARNVNTAGQSTISPGGVFTLGQLDANQYSGDVSYTSLTGNEGYWTIPLQSISVNGASTSAGSDTTAAIDTGTTLIIAPPTVARNIYSQIPNAASLSGYFSSDQGYYSLPCNTNVQVALTFGGNSYTINSADMTSGAIDNQGNCLGGILGTDLGSGAPAYIVGNVFLKNVFSVYRYSPAAVGFASLKGNAAQTAATTTGAITVTGGATAVVSSSASSSNAGGYQPPILSTASDGSSGSLAGGSGLPAPTAASTNSASSPSLTPANGSNSNSNSSSGASSTHAHAFSLAACIIALAAGSMVAIF
jgi:cathepsin D